MRALYFMGTQKLSIIIRATRLLMSGRQLKDFYGDTQVIPGPERISCTKITTP